MRALPFIFLSILFATTAFSQKSFQGSFIPGPTANSVDLVIRPNTAFSGYLTNVVFVIQIPDNVAQPTFTLTPLATNFGTVDNFVKNTDPATDATTPGYKNYQFGATNANTTGVNIASGTTYPVVRVAFNGGPASPATAIRLAHLVDGGPSTLFQFYVEANWGGVADQYTNYRQMFYGSTIFPNAPVGSDAAGYSTYQYSQILTALPVSWLNFNAVRNINDVRVTWDVANEINVDRYELEVSTIGTDFVKFATVQKSANSNTSYSHLDVQVARYSAKQLHYRIKQVDKDGKFTYSPTKTVRLDVKGETALYPNPAKDGFTLTIPYLNANQKRVQLQLVNGLGQVVERRDVTRLAAANYYFSLNSSLVTSGEYMLKIFEDGELMETKKVSVKR